MENVAKLGILGKNISYSFSKKYFENKFRRLMLKGYQYDNYDIDDISEVEKIFDDTQLLGLNVTIPYKEKIIAYLHELSDEAEKIGAVNCISIRNNIRKGYNTDVFGFEKTLLLHRQEKRNSALILGNGGAAKAVKYVLDKHNIPHRSVFRAGELNFENLSAETVAENLLIIQCTPVGTFPNTSDCLDFPFGAVTANHLVIDLIYNPEFTTFLKNASQRGAQTVNGYYMLEQQAEKSWEIWSLK